MNLIFDPWIPVVLQSGSRRRIRPADLTAEDRPVRLDAPRADFNGALIQFLIGLLQCTRAPAYPRDWRRDFDTPPAPEVLHESFSSIAKAFELDPSQPPAFLQDAWSPATSKWEPIERLLVEWPESGIFVRRAPMEGLCRPCTAAAIISLTQTGAPSGRGYFSGLRGGGPVTTLLLDPHPDAGTLFHTCWLNVLKQDQFMDYGAVDKRSLADRFPWFEDWKSGKSVKRVQCTPENSSPDQVFFSQSRRLRLHWSDVKGFCGLCGYSDNRLATEFQTESEGLSYSGGWRHPLSPQIKKQDGSLRFVETPGSGMTYRNWPGWVLGAGGVEPASVLSARRNQMDSGRSAELRVWAFGFQTANAKIRSWNESIMPWIDVAQDLREAFAVRTHALVAAVDYAAWALCKHVAEAVRVSSPTKKTFGQSLNGRLWRETEDRFYEMVDQLRSDPVGIAADQYMREWRDVLEQEVSRLFNQAVDVESKMVVSPRSVAMAWKALSMKLRGPKMYKQLGISPPGRERKKKISKKEILT
ncbi:MAG: type I-E CRISPR-associated protein Cse1/CasA [Planctomycetota bacterium]|nr:MAG: type I-E CRISPR-associated protein Cse1/CasA [Planctomycetota bacterium]